MRGRSGKSLLRHADPLRALEDGELGVPDKVCLHKCTIPGGIATSRRQHSGRIVVGRVAGSGDDVPVTLSEPGAIGTMLGKDLKVEVAAHVKQAFKTHPAKSLIAQSRAWDRPPAAGPIQGWGLSHQGVPAN